MKYIFALFCFYACIASCRPGQSPNRINTAHLDHLYEEIVTASGDSAGIVHIYSEFPDYTWVGDEDEGIACVDDAARAAVFYLRHHTYADDHASYRKGRMLLRFLLSMQAENGYFYNFIWPDHTINKTGTTSRAQPDWWSWRTLWAFSEAQDLLQSDDPLGEEVRRSRNALMQPMLADLSSPETLDTFGGIATPAWLPYGSAADQAAVILTGLSMLPSGSRDSLTETLMLHLANGIIRMQVENEDSFPHGAFLSWRNVWHAYGNVQAYALLKAGTALDDERLMSHALREIDVFYPQLWSGGWLSAFEVRQAQGAIRVVETTRYPQIAYGLRPVIWACLEAHKVTGQGEYLSRAEEYGRWFAGENPAKVQMYDPETGKGYDGVTGEGEINWNAGAESTIEALLAIQELEMALHNAGVPK